MLGDWSALCGSSHTRTVEAREDSACLTLEASVFLQRLAGSKEEVDVTGAAVALLSTLEADAKRRANELAVIERALAFPSPATHAISAEWEAGEIVFQTRLLRETVSHALRGAQPLFQNTVWDTLGPRLQCI